METTEKVENPPEYICRDCGAIYVAKGTDEITITKKCPICKGTMDLKEE